MSWVSALWDAQAEGSEVQDRLQFHSEFEASQVHRGHLQNMRECLLFFFFITCVYVYNCKPLQKRNRIGTFIPVKSEVSIK